MSSCSPPLLRVQHPPQSLSAHSSSTVTTIVFPVCDLRHKSCSASAGMPFEATLRFGNTATMSRDATHDSGFTQLPHSENSPSYRHPLSWMHSGLPGSGYEVKYVFLALRHVNPGLVQVSTGPTTLLPLDDPELEQLLPLLLDAPELFAVPASVDDPLEKPEPPDDPELVADTPLSCDAEPLDELDPAYEPELLDDRSLLPELADDAGAGVSEAHPPSLATTEITPSAIAKGRLRVITPHLRATDGRDQ